MPMWIFFNQGINELKPPVLTTYLRTMWKLSEAQKDSLCRGDLVAESQKPDTLSKHLKRAKDAGLLEIVNRKYEINGNFRSLPNVYTICNPTHKIWLDTLSDISDVTSYLLQRQMGKQFSDYYNKKYEFVADVRLLVDEVTHEDLERSNFCETLSFRGIQVKQYTQYVPGRTTPHIQVR